MNVMEWEHIIQCDVALPIGRWKFLVFICHLLIDKLITIILEGQPTITIHYNINTLIWNPIFSHLSSMGHQCELLMIL